MVVNLRKVCTRIFRFRFRPLILELGEGKRKLVWLFTGNKIWMMAPEREGETCTVVAMDPNSITYSVCAACEKPLPIDSVSCKFCVFRAAFNAPPFRTKRLFRLMVWYKMLTLNHISLSIIMSLNSEKSV